MTQTHQPDPATVLVALQAYAKLLKGEIEELRAAIQSGMAARRPRVERVGAFLDDDTRLGTISYTSGAMKAVVTDMQAAVAWCRRVHPDEIVGINPAFLKAILDFSVVGAKEGDPGADPRTGEMLPWVKVQRGTAYITVTTTPEADTLAAEILGRFPRELMAASAPAPEAEPPAAS